MLRLSSAIRRPRCSPNCCTRRARPRLDDLALVLAPGRGPARYRPPPGRRVLDHRMTVPEVPHLLEWVRELVRPQAADVGQVVEIGGVGRQAVEAVDAVLRQQLPVGVDEVVLSAADDLHAGFALVGDQVDDLLGPGEVVRQADGVAIEIDEVEVAVVLEARHADQVGAAAVIMAVAVVAVGVARGEAAVHVERPAVIETLEGNGVAARLAHQRRPAMRAGVEERVHRAAAVPIEHQFARPYRPGQVVAVLGDLRPVAEVEPAFVEDRAPLGFQNLLIGEGLAGDAEQEALAVFHHQPRAGGRRRDRGTLQQGHRDLLGLEGRIRAAPETGRRRAAGSGR